MKSKLNRFFFPLTFWYLISVAWLVHVSLMGVLIAFRGIKNAGLADAFKFDDVPPLKFLDNNYASIYWPMLGCGIASLAAWIPWVCCSLRLGLPRFLGGKSRWDSEQKSAGVCIFAAILFLLIGSLICSFSIDSESEALSVDPISAFDWAALVCLAIVTWLLPALILRLSSSTLPDGGKPIEIRAPRSSRTIRNGMAYLLGASAVFIYAWRDHQKFWDPELNRGFKYAQFFAEGEIPDANLVLYSTSVLFASLAAIAGCVVLHIVRRASGGLGRPTAVMSYLREPQRLVILLAASWAVAIMAPWQIKVLPEIQAERGWILPAVSLVFTTAALTPLMYTSLVMLLRDFSAAVARRREKQGGPPGFFPRRSELALFNFVLFPVYPLLRTVRWAGAGALYLVLLLAGAAAVTGLTWLVNKVNELFTFDDWRDMIRSGLLPFLKVVFALLAAYFAYVFARRAVIVLLELPGKIRSSSRIAAQVIDPLGRVIIAVLGEQRTARLKTLLQSIVRSSDPDKPNLFQVAARPLVLVASLACMSLATWPFWGWDGVHKNVFARTVEFSSRHDFELRFLHWVFDFDRDGYAAVLHGADPDDFDRSVQAGGIAPPRDDNRVPIDRFEIVDQQKAKDFPNVIIFFFEGVVPRALSCYGQREVVGTPHMDSIAREGTIFTQARCHYPSTWDGWFAVCNGRFMRIKEMDVSRGFGNRYVRRNNLYKILRKAGVNRWCHPIYPPFVKMLVPRELRKAPLAWKPDFNTALTDEEDKRGLWKGDKRCKRMLQFIESIKPGEKFFIAEHMSETHFPWVATPQPMAKKLGFPDGFEKYSGDAVINGLIYKDYTYYFRMITRMDAEIGLMIQKLKEKKLYDNTMIVFVGDHGCQWWEHERMYYVSHLYEAAIRMPLIIKFPGIPGGRICHDPVLQVDVLPTLMELAGMRHINPDKKHPFPCRSLVPLMTGTATQAQKRGYRERDVILTTHYDKLGLMSHFQWKLIFNRPTGTYYLFDLKNDPNETRNLADAKPKILAEMMEKLRKMMKNHGPIIGGIKE
ncbi:MAG: sulfatase-like hydrolase/transferase [Planctomycetes bacterium]|nr:sulfatase-like hydrolase/transferase [Planctomycetota bacterium]